MSKKLDDYKKAKAEMNALKGRIFHKRIASVSYCFLGARIARLSDNIVLTVDGLGNQFPTALYRHLKTCQECKTFEQLRKDFEFENKNFKHLGENI